MKIKNLCAASSNPTSRLGGTQCPDRWHCHDPHGKEGRVECLFDLQCHQFAEMMGKNIGKSQDTVKMRIQEHIGEVTKLYPKNILATNHRSQTTTPSPQPSQTQSVTPSTPSLGT
jgi:hypothetical protein